MWSNTNAQDTKQEGDADVDMKTDEASPRDGDVSPITQSVSNLPEESKPSTSKPKKTEPLFEQRPNFSRVTPAQLAYISFLPDGRYQPVRAVSQPAKIRGGDRHENQGPRIGNANEQFYIHVCTHQKLN
jgi:26S proteasome regulatory subunit RPN2 C-terminal domain